MEDEIIDTPAVIRERFASAIVWRKDEENNPEVFLFHESQGRLRLPVTEIASSQEIETMAIPLLMKQIDPDVPISAFNYLGEEFIKDKTGLCSVFQENVSTLDVLQDSHSGEWVSIKSIRQLAASNHNSVELDYGWGDKTSEFLSQLVTPISVTSYIQSLRDSVKNSEDSTPSSGSYPSIQDRVKLRVLLNVVKSQRKVHRQALPRPSRFSDKAAWAKTSRRNHYQALQKRFLSPGSSTKRNPLKEREWNSLIKEAVEDPDGAFVLFLRPGLDFHVNAIRDLSAEELRILQEDVL